MLSKDEFIDVCCDACDNGTFVTDKHKASHLSRLYSQPRSVNCMDNPETASYLRAGNFQVHCYSDTNANHSPELYLLTPSDPSIVPGSGVPQLSNTPTTQCDVFSVPSGVVQGWHGFAYNSPKVTTREANAELTLRGELT